MVNDSSGGDVQSHKKLERLEYGQGLEVPPFLLPQHTIEDKAN